jgi:hypothetical protein
MPPFALVVRGRTAAEKYPLQYYYRLVCLLYQKSKTNSLNSKQLQSASLTAEQASTSRDKMCSRLDELRTDKEFESLITKVETRTGLAVKWWLLHCD